MYVTRIVKSVQLFCVHFLKIFFYRKTSGRVFLVEFNCVMFNRIMLLWSTLGSYWANIRHYSPSETEPPTVSMRAPSPPATISVDHKPMVIDPVDINPVSPLGGSVDHCYRTNKPKQYDHVIFSSSTQTTTASTATTSTTGKLAQIISNMQTNAKSSPIVSQMNTMKNDNNTDIVNRIIHTIASPFVALQQQRQQQQYQQQKHQQQQQLYHLRCMESLETMPQGTQVDVTNVLEQQPNQLNDSELLCKPTGRQYISLCTEQCSNTVSTAANVSCDGGGGGVDDGGGGGDCCDEDSSGIGCGGSGVPLVCPNGTNNSANTKIPYQVLDMTTVHHQHQHQQQQQHQHHHHHCCHKYHPYHDSSLSEPSCPFFIYRESPSSATTISGGSNSTTTASIYTPSPYQSSGDLDFTSDCCSDYGAIQEPNATDTRFSKGFLVAGSGGSGVVGTGCGGIGGGGVIGAKSGKLFEHSERYRSLVNRPSSGTTTPLVPHYHHQHHHPHPNPSRNNSAYYYTHRHSSSAVIMSNIGTTNSGSGAISNSTSIVPGVPYTNRRHRSSYPSYGIRHSFSGTLRIGPRLYRGRSSQRCAHDHVNHHQHLLPLFHPILPNKHTLTPFN